MATENRHPDRDVGVLFSTPINLKTQKILPGGPTTPNTTLNLPPGIPELLSGSFNTSLPIHPQPVDSFTFAFCVLIFLFRSRYHGELSVFAFAYQDKQRALSLLSA